MAQWPPGLMSCTRSQDSSGGENSSKFSSDLHTCEPTQIHTYMCVCCVCVYEKVGVPKDSVSTCHVHTAGLQDLCAPCLTTLGASHPAEPSREPFPQQHQLLYTRTGP